MILAVILLSFITFVLLFLQFRYVKSLVSRISSLFYAENAETPSQFAQTTIGIVDMVFERFKESARMAMLGDEGHIKRQEKELMRDLTQEQVSGANPILGALFSQLPKKWQNRMMNNPSALMAGLRLLQGSGKALPPGTFDNPNGNGHSDIIERISRAQ